MKKTFKELQEIDAIVGGLYQENPSLKETKFGYAYSRYYEKNYAPVVKELQEDLKLLYVEHALEDEKTKAIIIDKEAPRGYAYSKQGMKDMFKAEKELFEKYNEKEIEVEAYIATYVPELTDEQKEKLKGIVI